MEASKYFLYHVLLSGKEMESLVGAMPSFRMYNVSQVTSEREISFGQFLSAYHLYIEGLTRGEVVINAPLFSAAWSAVPEAISSQEMKDGRFLQKAVEPVIQLRAHFYSISEGEVRPMSFGKGSISWGIQFGFPLLYRDAKTKEVIETLKKGGGNVPLFQALKGWMRTHTRPAKMRIGEIEVITSLRKGVNCEI
ncbi:MAG: hypothetical protein KBC64_05910 [Simkaniaceae bacterium]|nr:hypothetical protein [Simkaniaceae bacterium]